MSKNNMNIKYKKKRRERKEKVDEKDIIKKNIITAAIIIVSILGLYLILVGLEKIGLYELGYKRPNIVSEIKYENILLSEVEFQNEKEYIVLLDNYLTNKHDAYIKALATKYDKHSVYYVSLDDKLNSKLSINYSAPTLIKVKNNRVEFIYQEVNQIEEYLK